MDFDELRRLVKRGEGQHTEFKLKATHPEKIVRGMVALANSEGGWLFLGVDDDRLIKGVKFPVEDEYVMLKAINEYTSPLLHYTLERIPTEENPEREVLAFHIAKATELHYFKDNPTERKGKVYVRVQDKSFKASLEMWEILKIKFKNKSVKFSYGENEKLLLQYLEKNKHITVGEFAALAHISRSKASKTLIILTASSVLKILPQESGTDFFEFNEMPV